MPELADLLAQADHAVGSGNLHLAEQLLGQAADSGQHDAQPLLKLAGIQRATGRPEVALATVERALSIDPREFTALLMRASLLDRLGRADANEAWSHAIAQKPQGDLPPGIAEAVARGEQRVESWYRAREDKLKAGMASLEDEAGPDLKARFERFRSNIVKRTRPYHSEPTHFHYPGLAEYEFHPRGHFPWLAELEAETETILAELAVVMSAERAELLPYIHYDEHQPLQQWRDLNNSRDWTAIHLIRNGERIEANASHCPRTLALLEKFDQPHIAGASPNAMFSLLAPNTRIPPHVGVNNTRLVCHLPLIVPQGCWFRVGAETRQWETGQAFVFDDTIEHEAMNPSDELRVVFIFDIWRPELQPVERRAIAAAIEAESVGVGSGL